MDLLQYVDRRGQTSTFTYDNLNRLATEAYSDSSLTRTYDFFGRLEQVNDSAAGVFGFNPDLAGRLLSSTNPKGSLNYTYDGRGFMASRQVVGQPVLSYSYDPVGNLVSAAMPQAAASFTYDPRNLLSKITRMNGVSSTLGYDSDARLLSLSHAGTAMIDTESYTFDAISNRSGHSTNLGQALITQPVANQFNAANQLTLVGSVPDTYDANGNLVQEGATTTYTWDGRNRLKSITTAAGQTTNFTYDFAGNMIQQADSGTTLNFTKTFVLDDLTDVAYEEASDGTSYSVLAGRGIDSHLAIAESNGQVQYGLTDAINSTVATTDQTGAVGSQFRYEPFGQATATGFSYPFQFTGRVPVTGNLDYYRARFYNTQTGRFISEDPIGLAGGINLYGYVGNNPTGFGDPSGLTGRCIAWVYDYARGTAICTLYAPDDPGLLQPGPTPIGTQQPTPLPPSSPISGGTPPITPPLPTGPSYPQHYFCYQGCDQQFRNDPWGRSGCYTTCNQLFLPPLNSCPPRG